MKLKRSLQLNQKGFAHHVILPALVVLGVAVIGVRVLTASHADPLPAAVTSGKGNYTTVAATDIYANACYNGTNTVEVTRPVVPPVDTATSFFSQVSDVSANTYAANSTNFDQTQLLYANPGDTLNINVYHATAGEGAAKKLDPSNVLSGQSLVTTALATCSNKTVVPAYVGNGYTVSPITITETISRATASVNDGYLYNPATGVTIADTTSSAGQFNFSQLTNGTGFAVDYDGGIQPNGSLLSPLAISQSNANGTYSGTATLTLNSLQGKGGSVTGPTIDYTITLTD